MSSNNFSRFNTTFLPILFSLILYSTVPKTSLSFLYLFLYFLHISPFILDIRLSSIFTHKTLYTIQFVFLLYPLHHSYIINLDCTTHNLPNKKLIQEYFLLYQLLSSHYEFYCYFIFALVIVRNIKH